LQNIIVNCTRTNVTLDIFTA